MDYQARARKIYGNGLFKDSVLTLLGNALGKGLTVLSGIIVARLLGKDVYGEFGLLRNTLLVIAVFSTMGLGYTATVFVAETKQKSQETLRSLIYIIESITVCFSGIISSLFFIFANYIAIFLEDATLEYPLRLLSVIIVFNAITTSQAGILAGMKNFKGLSLVNIVSGVLNFLLTCGMTAMYGFEGALIALLVSQIINCLLNSLLLNNSLKSHSPIVKFSKERTISLLKMSVPVALQEMSSSFGHWALSIVLLKISNYGEMGMVSAAGQWVAILLFVPISLKNVTLSYMTNADHNSFTIMQRMLVFNLAVTLIPTFLIFLLHKYFDLLYGQTFHDVGYVISLAGMYVTVNSMFSVFSSEYMARKMNWILYAINLSRDIFRIPILLLLVMLYSVRGAYANYITCFITEIFAVLACYIILRHKKTKFLSV